MSYQPLFLCAKLNLLPCKFSKNGSRLSLAVSASRILLWKCLLASSTIYAVYINGRLMQRLVWRGTEGDYSSLGIHLVRSIMSVTFSFWAYDGFLLHGGEKQMLYNWIHNKPSSSSESGKTGRIAEFSSHFHPSKCNLQVLPGTVRGSRVFEVSCRVNWLNIHPACYILSQRFLLDISSGTRAPASSSSLYCRRNWQKAGFGL